MAHGLSTVSVHMTCSIGLSTIRCRPSSLLNIWVTQAKIRFAPRFFNSLAKLIRVPPDNTKSSTISAFFPRSEERRVGKEGRSLWATYTWKRKRKGKEDGQ